MASEKILMQKQTVIDEIKDRAEKASTIVLFDYRGITDSEAKELRIKLRETNSDYKVYKNTLMARAFNDLGIDLMMYFLILVTVIKMLNTPQMNTIDRACFQVKPRVKQML